MPSIEADKIQFSTELIENKIVGAIHDSSTIADQIWILIHVLYRAHLR
jgi:hypothetical protein